MKILTWNINGIRSVKQEMNAIFTAATYDIICVQETKVTRDQLDEPSAIIEGYNSYFSFSKGRSGYSGVATFVKDSCIPVHAEESISGVLAHDQPDGIGCHGDQSGFSDEEIQSLDNEGRTVITQHKIMDNEGNEGLLTIVNVYCPRADPENEERKTYKIRFYELLQIRVEAILKTGSRVIVLGDINSSHKKLDHCDPDVDKEFYAHPGRRWLSQFLWDPERDGDLDQLSLSGEGNLVSGAKFVDTFRIYHTTRPDAFTCWHTAKGSRATNYGTRIDYIFADIDLARRGFTDCNIMPEVMGSDHCPVQATLDWEVLSSKKCPSFCTKLYPEFTGKQQKLSMFFVKKDRSDVCPLTKSKSQEISSSQGSTDSGMGTDCGQKPPPELVKSKSSPGKLVRSPSDSKKRQGMELKQSQAKKTKTDVKSSQSKQGSLLSFFGTKSTSGRKETTNQSCLDKNGDTNAVSDNKGSNKSDSGKTNKEATGIKSDSSTTKSVQNPGQTETNASASWKNLLKGPPPAPLCKGHQEPCLLRTVKKDSLNKGRQFWVCNRPEGHKTNPQARCDHFVWVEKKRKS